MRLGVCFISFSISYHIGSIPGDFFHSFSEISPLEKIESLEMLRALEAGWNIKIVLASKIHPEIDNPKDVLIAERYLKRKRSF